MFFRLGNSIVLQKQKRLLFAVFSTISCCLIFVSFLLAFSSHCCVPGQTKDRWSSLSNFSYSREEIGWEEQCSSPFITRKVCGEMKSLKDLWRHNELFCHLYNSLSTAPWLSRAKISVRSADVDLFLCWPSPGITVWIRVVNRMIHHLMNIPYAFLLTVAQRPQLQGQHKKAELSKKFQQRENLMRLGYVMQRRKLPKRDDWDAPWKCQHLTSPHWVKRESRITPRVVGEAFEDSNLLFWRSCTYQIYETWPSTHALGNFNSSYRLSQR